MRKENNRSCSFCGKTQENVKRIVAGPGVYICNECIKTCNEVLEEGYIYEEDTYALNEENQEQILPPAEIKRILDEYVIGQEEAKKTIIIKE